LQKLFCEVGAWLPLVLVLGHPAANGGGKQIPWDGFDFLKNFRQFQPTDSYEKRASKG
jgi:hypothetical protein